MRASWTQLAAIVDINKLQFSFVPRKGTTDAISVARQLQEKYRASGKPLYFAFVEPEKASDRVPRKELWWSLRGLGVEDRAVRVIQECMPMSEAESG